MTVHPLDALRIRQGAEYLQRLPPHHVAEFLIAFAARIGGLPALLSLLAEYQSQARRVRK